MKSLKQGLLIASLVFSAPSFSCTEDGSTGFLPENNFKISVGAKRLAGLTEAQFNAVIDKVETLYSPIVSNLGGKLMIDRKWTDATVNAYAQRSGTNWKVSMFGGLARHKTVTEDGFSLVVCHEIGHHIGGAPKKGGTAGGGWWGGGASWASNEGQADYFATLKCLRKSFLNDDNAAIVAKMQVPASVTNQCKKANRLHADDTALCIRMSMAGKSVSDLFSSLSKTPETKFETPDSKVVSATNDSHPAAQCRLDTYFSGSLCDVSMNEDVSQKDEVKGTCHPSLGHTKGNRPLCWFKPAKI